MRLVADNVTVDRGGRRIISGLAFTVEAGEALILTGRNGAGKTTLLRAIAGFLPLAGGEVRLDGGRDDTPVAEQCHFIGHRDGVKGAMTVLENARFISRFLGDGADPAAALERLGLAPLAGAPAAYLSAGQRRRLGLSRLLLAHRPLWLLDEPTVSLDVASVAVLAGIVREHVAAGGLAIAATHVPLGLEGARELRLGEAGTGGPSAGDAAA